MDQKTYEALGRIIKDVEWQARTEECAEQKDVEQVKGWMEEVAKEYDEDKSEKCVRCGRDADEAYSSLWEGNLCAVCWHEKHDK